MLDLIEKFPVRSEPVRRELVGMDICPECGAHLDTGKACSRCIFDGKKLVPARYMNVRIPRLENA